MADVSVKMGVSGIAQFKQGMKDAEASVKTLDAAMKANEKSFKATGDAESHLAAQTNLLNQKLQQQKNIVKNAEQALKQMEANGVRTTSAAYQNMQRKLIEAQSGMMDTEAELDNLGIKASGAAEKTDQLSNSLGGLNKKISLDQVISAVGKVTDGLERAGQKAVRLGKAIWDELMESARWADDSATMAMMYGVDLDTFMRVQKLVQNGMDTSVEAILKSQSKLKKNVGGGSDSFMATMKELGLVVTEYGGKVAEGIDHLITDDSVELFWKAGQAIMSLGDEYEQEAKAQELFGKSWRELIPLFKQFSSQEEFDKALENVTVNTEDEVNVLAELNDKVGELKGNFDTLENKVMAGLAPAMTKAAEALSGLLDNLIKYLDTPEGQQALDDMAKAVEGLFSDISEIDPQEVVKGFADVFNGIVDGLKWLETNSGTVVGALEAVAIGWGALKLTGGALEIYKLIQGISGLAGAGAATAAGEAGAAAGSAWGGGFAAAVMKTAPWLVGLYTLLDPAETGDNSLADANGNLTEEGWADFKEAMKQFGKNSKYRDANGWIEDMLMVGELFGDLGRISEDTEAINAINRFRGNGRNTDDLIASLQALGYVLKAAEESGEANMPEEVKQVPIDENAPLVFKDRRHGGTIPVIDPVKQLEEELGGAAVTVPAEPEVAEDAAEKIAEEVGTVMIPAQLIIEDLSDEEYAAMFGEHSHANGLPMVPFDGYPALLHKGERVLPAREVSGSRTFSSNLYVESMYMNNGQDADGLAARVAAENRRIMSGFGS